jgi:hypothetical protein
MLIIVFGAAVLAALSPAAWSLARLWRSVPRRNHDMVLF